MEWTKKKTNISKDFKQICYFLSNDIGMESTGFGQFSFNILDTLDIESITCHIIIYVSSDSDGFPQMELRISYSHIYSDGGQSGENETLITSQNFEVLRDRLLESVIFQKLLPQNLERNLKLYKLNIK